MLEPELICKWIGIWCFIFEFEFEQILYIMLAGSWYCFAKIIGHIIAKPI